MIFRSVAMTFSLYSKLPMPALDWEKKNMRLVLAFFPLVGLVEGMLFVLLYSFFRRIQLHALAAGGLLSAFPFLFTGGIHADGFMDTMDAIGSYADPKKKLAIMKDSHVGAHAVLSIVLYLLVYFGFCASMVRMESAILFGMGMVLERALSTLAILLLPCARENGMAKTMADASAGFSTWILGIFMILTIAAMLYYGRKTGILMVLGAGGAFFWYRSLALRNFGGITGDTSGFFLQICELVILGLAVSF